MKKILATLILLSLTAIGFSIQPPYPVMDRSKSVNPATLNKIVNDIYDKFDTFASSISITNNTYPTYNNTYPTYNNQTYNYSTTISSSVIDDVPVGQISAWISTSSIPTNYLYCNGDAVSRTNFSNLFAVIGTTFGSGDGSTTFNIPDLRGMFLRGLDNGRGYDSDSNRSIGSYQTDTFQAHHTQAGASPNFFYTAGVVKAGTDSSYVPVNGGATANIYQYVVDGSSGIPRTSNETRPKNMAIAYIIKYRLAVSSSTSIFDSTNTWTATQNFNIITAPVMTSIGVSTGSIQTSLNNVILSTGIIQASLNSVILSTGSLQTQINNVIISTGIIQTSLNNVILSTGIIQSSLNSVIVSTGYLQTQINTTNTSLSQFKVSPSTGILSGTLASNIIVSSVAVAKIGIPQINASGTADNTTYLRGDGSWATTGGSSASGDSLQKVYTQTAHGFSKGKAIYNNGSQWIMAQANSVGTADALGVVNDVGVDTFTITMAGYINGLSGLSGGSVYYLSDTSSGTLTTTEPTTYGSVSKPMLFALGTSSGIVVNMRGVTITQPGVYDGVPVGAMQIWHSTSSIPNDFLYANGQAVSRTTYSTLFEQIGTKFGSGDGSTTFNVPDGRGMFLRGLDNGRGFDDETSRVIGSTETDKFQAHYHDLYSSGFKYGAITVKSGADSTNVLGLGGSAYTQLYSADGSSGTPRTGLETRPKNLAVSFIIKYRVNMSTASGLLDTANTWVSTQTHNSIIVMNVNASTTPAQANSLYKNNMIGGWIKFNGTGTIAITESYNVSSITDDGTGTYTIYWDRDFAGDSYCVQITANKVAGNTRIGAVNSQSAGSVQIIITDVGANPQDADSIYVLAVGKQ